MSQPAVVHSIVDLRAFVAAWRRAGDRIGLVPTMGALHDGHVSLARILRGRTSRTIVSIFVNPTQFAPGEDFTKYPRPFEADLARLTGERVDVVFRPAATEMYPGGFSTTVTVGGPALAGLEDAIRPTHFAGVATVVAKLLTQAAPDVAIFGEKDYQQLAVIRRMARDLDLPVEILGGPTIREADGLAMSSRNVYLDAGQRRLAPELHRAMQSCADDIGREVAIEAALAGARARLAMAGFEVDYLELRDAASLEPVAAPDGRPLRMLAAARIGRTRLIDNIGLYD